MTWQKIRLLGGATVTVDLGKLSKCKKCNKTIYWATTKNAKAMPICQDRSRNWLSHFVDCPYSNNFKLEKKPGAGDRLDESKRQKERDLWH